MHPINEHHRRVLEKWRHAMDLVGPGPIEPHFEDSINAVQNLPNCANWIDLGSGAGFPGFALAAQQSQAHILMVESRQKRCSFLKTVKREAKIQNVRIVNQRTETITETFDGVISRAYKPPIEYLKDATRLLNPKGIVVLMLGSNPTFELSSDWALVDSHRYNVSDHTRLVWILQYRRHN